MSAPKSYETISSLTAVTALSATVYNAGTHYPESLTNSALASGTGWTVAGDFTVSTGEAVYLKTATGTGSLSQAVGTLTRTGRSGATYDFTYTVSSPGATVPALTVSTAFASAATSLVSLDTAGTYTVSFTAAATPGAFTIDGVLATAGGVTIDTFSLLERIEAIYGNRQVKRAVISVEAAAINFTTDGTTPTITSGTYQGHTLNAGDILTLNDITEIQKFRCINSVASSGALIKATYSFL